MVRYYGYYPNVARGKRKTLEENELIPSVLESDDSSKECRKNWARLIQKIYEVDPLTCPKCSGTISECPGKNLFGSYVLLKEGSSRKIYPFSNIFRLDFL